MTTKEFAEGFQKVNREILDFAGEKSLAHVIRLHYWYATDEMAEVLKKEGVEGLLCGNESNSCYNLNKEQAETLLKSKRRYPSGRTELLCNGYPAGKNR